MAEHKGFYATFWQLIRILKPFPAALLVALSILETALVAKVGQVSGQYYLIIVDRQPSTFLRISLISLALYICNTMVKSTSRWLSELLALRWRAKLTSLLQHGYCQDQNFFWVQQKCDNADQRITHDVNLFCQRLASIALVIAAIPFQAVYYTFWTWQITSGYVVLAVYTFFVVSLLLESAIIKPVAKLVYKQERAEGDFRFGHMRLRALLKEVALYKAGETEKAHLELLLQPVLANQLRLVMWRWLLNACITGLDYAGALLTYTCLGLLVFTGSEPSGMDQGQRAKWVSNASFATLTLIYTFTQILDLGTQMSTLAGVTMRIGGLLQALHLNTDDQVPVQAKPGSPTDANLRPELEPLLGKQDNHDLAIVSGSATEASDCEADKQTAGAFNTQRYQPANSLPADQCGSGRDHTQNSEDDHTGQLVSGQTFSSATAPQQHGCSLHQHVSSDESQQDTPQQAEHDALQQAQHDAPQQAQHIAPQQARHDATQQAHHDSPQQAQHDACQQAQHNATQQAQHDFTLQPGHAQQPDQAHDDQNDTSHEQPHSGVQQDVRQQLASGPNFTLANFTCQRPDGATIVRQVDMQLEAGQVLLITGRSGSGKTTLVNALAGLWPQWHGHRQMLSPDQVLFTPQTPLAAPGPTLLEQILYPQPLLPSTDADLPLLQQLLRQVKLEHLLQRAQGLWTMPMDWTGMLSPGELQRLAVARVLYHRPALAVMDEPISALDAGTGIALLEAVEAAGIAIIVTSQPDTRLCSSRQSECWQKLRL